MKKPSRQIAQAQKLPDEEWNFGVQLKDERNVNLVRGVFFYEYFRCSKKLRDIVVRCRKYYFDEGGKKLRPPMPGWEGTNCNILYPEEKELIRKQTNGWEIIGDLVQGLMNNPKFPEIPALQILKEDNQNGKLKGCAKSWLCNLESSPALKFCREPMDGKDVMHVMDQVLSKPGIEYRFKGSVQAQQFESVIPVTIDWRKPNNQIIQDFRNEVLIGRRPEQFWKFEKISSQQVAIGSLCDKLPFRLRPALDWLGVSRRKDKLKTWREYFDCYHNGNFQRGAERGREADCRKSRLIIDWFENGAALKKEDFK